MHLILELEFKFYSFYMSVCSCVYGNNTFIFASSIT